MKTFLNYSTSLLLSITIVLSTFLCTDAILADEHHFIPQEISELERPCRHSGPLGAVEIFSLTDLEVALQSDVYEYLVLCRDVNISTYYNPFPPILYGIFDGNGHSLVGFHHHQQALFLEIAETGQVQDLILRGVKIDHSYAEEEPLPSAFVAVINRGTIRNILLKRISMRMEFQFYHEFGGVANSNYGTIENVRAKLHILGLPFGAVALINHGTIRNILSRVRSASDTVSALTSAAGVALYSTGLIENVRSNFKGRNIGLAVGITSNNYGIIQRVSTRLLLNEQVDVFGGVSGSNVGVISDAHSFIRARITNPEDFGGISSHSSGEIENASVRIDAQVSLEGNSPVTPHYGGAVGFMDNGQLNQVKSYGELFIDSQGAPSGVLLGGLVGKSRSSSILNSFSQISIEALGEGMYPFSSMGGLIGKDYTSNYQSPSQVSYCYSVSQFLIGDASVGGLIGSVEEQPVATTSSYWDSELSGVQESAGGVGKTTVEMMTQDTYTGWDFDNVWEMSGYPDFQ